MFSCYRYASACVPRVQRRIMSETGISRRSRNCKFLDQRKREKMKQEKKDQQQQLGYTTQMFSSSSSYAI
jgi:collagenase-like PrtC family protease